MIISMLNELRKMDEHSEIFNKELENIKNDQRELKNTITEMKTTLEGVDSRIAEAELISDMEDRMVEISAMEQN